MKRILVIGVILLFLGVAFAPSINANIQQETLDSELVEITTEICGLPGLEPQTVKLAQEETEEVDRLFDEIKIKLDNAETIEETVEIFNEAIVELDKYGLLGGLSVEQAQRLVTGKYQDSKIMSKIEMLYDKNRELFGNNSNLFCLVAGSIDKTLIVGPSSIFFFGLFLLRLLEFYILTGFFPNPNLIVFLSERALRSLFIGVILLALPIKVGGIITFGTGGLYSNHPSEGWVFSLGLLGAKMWNQPIWGQIFPLYDGVYFRYIGSIGFSGINLYLEDSTFTDTHNFFLGTSLWIKLDSEQPEWP